MKDEVDLFGHGREWWQQETGRWERKRDLAAAQIQKLSQQLRHLQFLDILPVEQGRIREEVRLAAEEQQKAERMLREVLPEEARKAGAPPGWLR